MRACGACFWGVFAPGAEAGACHNRPPFVTAVPTAEGVSILTLRPEVGRDEKGCYHFSHHAHGKGKEPAA